MADHQLSDSEEDQSLDLNPSYQITVDNPDEYTPEQLSDLFNAAFATYLKSVGDPSSSSSGAKAPPPQQHENANTGPGWEDLNPYRELYHAALTGNWEAAAAFLAKNAALVTGKVAVFSETALHVAASEGHSEFVEKILDFILSEEAAEPDDFGRTALHDAAIAGSLRAAVALVEKNPKLTNIVDQKGWTPLLYAALYSSGSKDLVWYLCLVTKNEDPSFPFTGAFAGTLVLTLAAAGYLDIVLYLLRRYENLATATTRDGVSLLSTLAATPFNFLSSSRLGFFERCIYSLIPVKSSYTPPESMISVLRDSQRGSQRLSRTSSTSSRSQHNAAQAAEPHWTRRLLLSVFKRMTSGCVKRLQDAKLRHQCAVELVQHICKEICKKRRSLIFNQFGEYYVLRDAAIFGITEIVKTMLKFSPDLIWSPLDQHQQTLLHYAIKHRREEIFNLFICNTAARHKAGPITREETILHLVAKLAPLPQLTSVSGAALQMQRELQWFKAVEKMVQPMLLNYKNEDGIVAREVFTMEHKQLAEAGEKWMKDTSNSCMIVSTLIATFVFAAAFTVPGGNADDGTPIYLFTKSFLVFVISDALALFSSVTSLLMFFSILTARYAEEDFHKLLPRKLIIGLVALFLSIAFMMIAFGATIFIVLRKRLAWISIPITLLASFPVSIFVLLQFPLFIQMFGSTFGNSIFSPQSPWL